MSKIRYTIRRLQFIPSILGILVNPFFFSRHAIYMGIQSFASYIYGKVLDVGCGNKPYRKLFSYSEYIGVDIESSGHSHESEDIDIYYDGQHIPYDSGYFDSVLCSEVLEHVFNSSEFLSEINRVMRQGGHLLITTPFIWDEHEQPYDFGRYSSFGLKSLLENHGFELVESKKTLADLRLLFLLNNAYVYKVFYKKIKHKVFSLLLLCVCLPIFSINNILGVVFYRMFPSNFDLYFGNIALFRKK